MKLNEIKICIADDHREVALGINAMLNDEPHLNVVGMFRNKNELMAWFGENKNEADVLLLDINMPTAEDGVDSCRFVRRECPYTKIITYSGHLASYRVSQLADLGVSGFLPKGSKPSVVKKVIKEVKNGKKHYAPSVVKMLNEQKTKQNQVESLTKRETEVLLLMLRGKKNAQIAQELSISENTVKTHRKNIKQKTCTEGLADLFDFAKNVGLIDI